MITITENFVSFEIAKLLKEKGFDGDTASCYILEDSTHHIMSDKVVQSEYYESQDSNEHGHLIQAPTLQMAMKWLKVEHNILLFLLPAQENGKLVYLVEVWTWNEEEGIYESTYAPMPRKEPGKAVEAAIKYCLENLI